jgi:uncharacterized membrane protein
LVFFVTGAAFLPLTFSLFKDFKDKGYIFSKIIGLAFITYFVFMIGSLKIAKFSEGLVYFSLLLFFIINYLIFIYRKGHLLPIIKAKIGIFLIEEIIFLIMLFFWSTIRSNAPDIYGFWVFKFNSKS